MSRNEHRRRNIVTHVNFRPSAQRLGSTPRSAKMATCGVLVGRWERREGRREGGNPKAFWAMFFGCLLVSPFIAEHIKHMETGRSTGDEVVGRNFVSGSSHSAVQLLTFVPFTVSRSILARIRRSQCQGNVQDRIDCCLRRKERADVVD